MNAPDPRQFLSLAEHAARVGAGILMEWRDKFTAREKGPKDLVTEADLASQVAIRKLLLDAHPDHDFLGEEDASLGGRQTERTSDFRWIVDPLDGTANYVHRLQTFATSIGLEYKGQIIAGCIFDPVTDECYTAGLGCGTTLNGQPIHVSDCQEISQALVAVSFRANVMRGSRDVNRFIETLHATQSIRRLGSAALNCCYVAAGRLDAYFATSGIQIWDVAAGILIITEAGGTLTAADGGSLNFEHPELLAASSSRLHGQMLEVLQRADQM
ncbi:Inositol-1-monophosphatase [Anatilimnocola aggregata]|uniref:Inositol-1-monophosphatase n=1 Tax=Anatilimnocola aggregata TaxID=2528021 RepID=A0A517YCQ0_9BACT|nr:inositol monophosphatase family protein [Anatilimnocola aggregata]QDU28017.1 Inositol-1-monophosphatase [Anatilimnocola aggregata]